MQEGSAGARGAAAEREGGGRWGRPGGRRAVPAGDVRASRPPSSTGRPPAGPLRAAGSGRRAAGSRLRSSAAGAGPGGCAAPGSEAWRGFCTSGPTISQVGSLDGLFWIMESCPTMTPRMTSAKGARGVSRWRSVRSKSIPQTTREWN